MDKILLLYNPLSGNGSFAHFLDDFIHKFQKKYFVTVLRLQDIELSKYIKELDDSYKAIVAAGGDGTINSVVNLMVENNIELPLGIIPTGTVNDFARYINMPSSIIDSFEVLLKNKQKKIDVGLVNNKYFVNVCAGGFLTSIPHQTDSVLKNRLGKIAYYLKGIQQLPKFQTLSLKFKVGKKEFEEDIFLFMILNSSHAGGYSKLTPDSNLDDGLFELIAIKAGSVYEITNALIDLFINKNLSNKNILYFKNKYFYIKPLNKPTNDTADIDGEKGPDYPLEIKVIPKKIKIIYND